MKLLEGKTAIITGGSRGIGKAIVEVFAKQGANVAFTYNSSSEAAKKIETETSIDGVKVKAYKSDASNFEQAQELASEVLKEFGSIDILINNAGITKDNLLMRMSEDDFDRVIEVNLKSVFNGVFSYSNVVEVDFVLENYSLSQNYPNPFNPSTSISFTLTTKTFVTLKIYNILGNEITTLVNELIPGGNHKVQFDATGLPSGIYLYSIIAGDFVETKKMVLMK